VIHSAPPPRLSLVPPSGLSVPPSGFSVPSSGFSVPPSGYSAPPSGFSVPPPRLSVAPPSGLSLRPPGLERGAVPEVAIQAGGVVASKTPLLIKTTLGSCISVCLYDPVTRMGGMNHFMLPGSPSDTDGSTRFGVHAMEVLINRLLKLGASRDRLVAKIVGGCSVVEFVGVTVAERNLRFVEDFLAMEGFEVKSRRVGGTHAMEVRFRTDTGEAFVRTVNDPGVTKRALRQDADYRERFALPAPAQAPAPTSTESTSDDDGITYFK
jgi:chemotaxis protein CheD